MPPLPPFTSRCAPICMSVMFSRRWPPAPCFWPPPVPIKISPPPPTNSMPPPFEPPLRVRGPSPNALARGVPGFGGFFYDESGTPVMYLKDAGQRANAERALTPYLQQHGVAAGRIQVRTGRFSWTELENWQAKVSAETLKLPGAVYVDADEAGNQVKIGVERGKGGQVRAALARLGLPAAAAVVEETEPVTFAAAPKPKPGQASLSGTRPADSGRRPDQFSRLPLHPRFQRDLGRPAQLHHQLALHQRPGRGQQHALLAAAPERRSRRRSGPRSRTRTTPRLPGCPSGRLCRRADASRARYDINAADATLVAFGKIAKTAAARPHAKPSPASSPSPPKAKRRSDRRSTRSAARPAGPRAG